METNDKIKIALTVAVIAIVVFLVYKLAGKIGLVKTREQKEKDKAVESLTLSEYFNPSYYKNKSAKPLGNSIADSFAKDIRKALKGFGTNEDLIYSTFAKLKNKVNISELADTYNIKYKADLKADIMNDLNDKEKAKLMFIINSLPNF